MSSFFRTIFKEMRGVKKNMEKDIIVMESDIYKTEIRSFNDYICKSAIMINRLWDEEIIDEILSHYKDGTDVIDIGAHVGLVSLGLLAKSRVNISNIHCFEPHPEIFSLLSKNTHKFQNIKIYPFALSDTQKLPSSPLVNLSLI